MNAAIGKAIKQMDEKISEIKNALKNIRVNKKLCIAIILFLNGLQALFFFMLK